RVSVSSTSTKRITSSASRGGKRARMSRLSVQLRSSQRTRAWFSACSAISAVILVGLGASIQAQQLPTAIPQTKWASGQDIVPYFEGWIRNPDGTFDLVFGYFNRNWTEEIVIAPGPDNRIEPNGPDAGQPTYFLPRRQRWIFRVKVPANFGN